MQTTSFDAPALYGDHHVSEVHRILLTMPGVKGVYASSAFQVIEVTFEQDKVTAEQIRARLEKEGYLGDMSTLAETGIAEQRSAANESQFRHTTVYESTRQTVSFARNVAYQGRPLWPCPGMGVVKTEKISD